MNTRVIPVAERVFPFPPSSLPQPSRSNLRADEHVQMAVLASPNPMQPPYQPDESMLARDRQEYCDTASLAMCTHTNQKWKPNESSVPLLNENGSVHPVWQEWLSCLLHDIIFSQRMYMNSKLLEDSDAGLQQVLGEAPDLYKWTYQAAQDDDYRKICRLSILRTSPLSFPPKLEEVAFNTQREEAVRAWKGDFRGDSARLLHDILASYLACPTTRYYARYVSHIQSSGTGKSRMHDELAKDILYIPLNLAPERKCCYPPADHTIAAWTKGCRLPDHAGAGGRFDPAYAQQRIQGLFYGLMTVTVRRLNAIQADPLARIPSSRISDIDQCEANAASDPIGLTPKDGPKVRATLFRLARLSGAFHEKMYDGCEPDVHGEYRCSFYDEVRREAENFVSYSTVQGDDTDNVIAAARKLHEFLDPLSLCHQEGRDPHLLAVICMDEAHELTDTLKLPGREETWTLFSQLQYPLRQIIDFPFFTVFPATTGKFHRVSPDPVYDPSERVGQHNFKQFKPITETGFDEFAEKVDVLSGTWTLSRVASTYNIAHLGRSLFPALWDMGTQTSQERLVDYARAKLLGPDAETEDELDGTMMLACLAVRLGLDFRGTRWVEREVERTQVEHHMRICLSATAGFQSLTTAAVSEPLLAEAASRYMIDPNWDAAGTLLSHIDSSYLDSGDRGELIAALLLLLARDRAPKVSALDDTRLQDASIDLEDDAFIKNRIVKVPDFLAALLKTDILNYLPTTYINEEDRDMTLQDAFKDGHIWFNHFLKVYDFDMFNKEYLARLIARGAAVIYASNQRGVDIVIPFLSGTVLHPDNVSAIFVQVKNDKSHTTIVKDFLFEVMDPLQLHMLTKAEHGKEKSIPIIRMVFALASSQSNVARPMDSTHGDCTTYDIWCAGTSNKTFLPIRTSEIPTYHALLLRSRKVTDAYEPKGSNADVAKLRGQARRRQHPAVGTDIHHFEKYLELEGVGGGGVPILVEESIEGEGCIPRT